MGPTADGSLTPSFEHIKGKSVFVVEVRPSSAPVYLKSKSGDEEDFFVRTGPQTVRLSVRDVVEYTKNHFEPGGP